VIKKAADAQRRGNHPMAYRLLEPEVRGNPDDARVVVAFWNAALACERADDAVPAVLRIIRKLASTDKPEQAAELWLELRHAAPSTLVDPSTLVRIALALEAEGRSEQVTLALREAVDPRNDSSLSPGLAVRIAEMARQLDPPTALVAAHRALTSPDLHEAKRARLDGLVAELEKAEAETFAKASHVPADAPDALPEAPATTAVTERAIDDALETLAPTARFSDIKVTEAMPTKLREEAVTMQVLAGRKVGVDYTKIEAVAAAEVKGLADHPVVVIDLVFNWGSQGDSTLRVVRLRSDGFDPRMIFAAPTDDPAEAFRGFLSELLARSNAIPLPDSDSALDSNAPAFEDLEAYQREVLCVES
jgi:hypothetical protein